MVADGRGTWSGKDRVSGSQTAAARIPVLRNTLNEGEQERGGGTERPPSADDVNIVQRLNAS